MSTINMMKKIIAMQAETMYIVRDASCADTETLVPLHGTPNDGTFDSDGKFDGLGELMILDDLEMINCLLDGNIPYPFRIAGHGVYMFDDESNEYKQICSDALWIEQNEIMNECEEMTA